MGRILLDQGKLSALDAERVLSLQKEKNLRFGEAAIQLGLISETDLQQALASQFDYPYLSPGEGGYSQELIAAYAPFSPQVESLRALRSQLVLRWFVPGHKTLAVVSANPREGTSYLAANLAVVFSQLGERTLLLDADMRHGRQQQLFGLDNQVGLSTVLAGRGSNIPAQRVPGLIDLSVITAGPTPPNPQELLGRDVFVKLLEKLAASFDVIIIDTPSGTGYADAQTISARAGGALLVARQNVTGLNGAGGFATGLGQLGTTLVGAVLNHF
jgi:receptor protein-tyrosine kinase